MFSPKVDCIMTRLQYTISRRTKYDFKGCKVIKSWRSFELFCAVLLSFSRLRPLNY